MNNIGVMAYTDYEFTKEIKRNASIVLIGKNKRDNSGVIVKKLANEKATENQIEAFKFEYEILEMLRPCEGVVTPLAFEKINNEYCIIMPDEHLISLEEYIKFKPLELNALIKIASGLLRGMRQIHDMNVVHKDINPSNILIDPASLSVKLIDFGIASLILRENDFNRNLNEFKGTIGYMPPEQVGRLNIDIDYRSDFYAFGMTLYECAAGMLPFRSDDLMESIHMHIVNEPVFELENFYNSKILIRIIRKLVAKDKKDRYQSILGIQHDLEILQQSIGQLSMETGFVPGAYDSFERLNLSQKIFGRAHEISMLENKLQRAVEGSSEMSIVSGEPGIGKTAIVETLRNQLFETRCYYSAFKADQYIQNLPFVAVENLFEKIVDQMLQESDASLGLWKSEFEERLGENLSIISDAIPKFKDIVEIRHRARELGALESLYRQMHAYQQFLAAVAAAEHPVVLYIDDIQWCDVASLNFFKMILIDARLPYTYVLGTYRNNELDDVNPVKKVIGEIIEARPQDCITIAPLAENVVEEMLRDTLRMNPESVGELAQIITRKTKGNPFYAKELIQDFYKKKYLKYDQATREWTWDKQSVMGMNVSENVVEYLISRLHELSGHCLELIKAAACVGSYFNCSEVAGFMDASVLKQALIEALDKELIIPLNQNYRYLYGETKSLPQVRFAFVHDKVQQAVYESLDRDDLKRNHLQLARFIRKKLRLDLHPGMMERSMYPQELLLVINHYETGIDLVDDSEERFKLAKYEYWVGIKSRATAFENSYKYLSLAYKNLSGALADKDPLFTKMLMSDLAVSSYLVCDIERANRLTDKLLKETTSDLEKAKVYSLRTTQLVTIGSNQEALEEGLKGLRLIQVNLPDNPGIFSVLKLLFTIKSKTARKGPEILLEKGEITEEKFKLCFDMLVAIGPAAYQLGNGNFFAVLIMTAIVIMLEQGHTEHSAGIIAAFGAILSGGFGDYATAKRYGDIALKLNDRNDSIRKTCSTYHLYSNMILPWVAHWSDMTQYHEIGIEEGYRLGDYNYMAMIAHHVHIWNPKLNLKEILVEKEKQRKIIAQTKYRKLLDETDMFIQYIMNLVGKTDHASTLGSQSYDVEAVLKRCHESGFVSGVAVYNLWMGELSVLYGDEKSARHHIEEVEKRMDSISGLPYMARFYLLRFLVYFSSNDRKDTKIAEKEFQRFEKLSAINPRAFLHLRHFEAALLASKTKTLDKVMAKFNEAIHQAGKEGWLRDEAMINEWAARYLQSKNLGQMAAGYIQEALRLYELWGAVRKAEQLTAQFKLPNAAGGTDDRRMTSRDRSKTSVSEINAELDLMTVIKASQALAGETELVPLLDKMMDIIIENAGAERGCFIVEDDGRYYIQADTSQRMTQDNRRERHEYRQSKLVSEPVVNYVIRTRESLVYKDAANDPDCSKDAYVRAREIRSLLGLPLIKNGKTKAIIYLENNKMTGVFTANSIKLLNLLGCEMLILYENALLYDNLLLQNQALESHVERRTGELKALNSRLSAQNEELAIAQRRLEELAMKDTLTKLYNRRKMVEFLNKAAADYTAFKTPYSLILADIDHFKSVNDTFGHECGDMVLKEVAMTLQNVSSGIISRWGGEEFLILLNGCGVEQAMVEAEKMRAAIEAMKNWYDGVEVRVTMSLGVTMHMEWNRNVDEVVANADHALYRSKKANRNKATCDLQRKEAP